MPFFPPLDKAASGVEYMQDHQDPVEFLPKDDNGIGRSGAAATGVAVSVRCHTLELVISYRV